MTCWLIHGFNVSDGGKGSVGRLEPHIPDSKLLSYGWTGLILLPRVNKRARKKLLKVIKPGDSIVAHSNGCLIAWEIAGLIPLSHVVCINPALRRDTVWPEELPVLCLYNSTDWVVQLGRIWGRLFSFDGIRFNSWGAAGRYGFDNLVNGNNWDTSQDYWLRPVKGHSGLFGSAAYWGHWISKWASAVTSK